MVDYVILHELVHTKIHNHSPAFWAELDKYVVNSKATARRLEKAISDYRDEVNYFDGGGSMKFLVLWELELGILQPGGCSRQWRGCRNTAGA
jgi:hypothetical protein